VRLSARCVGYRWIQRLVKGQHKHGGVVDIVGSTEKEFPIRRSGKIVSGAGPQARCNEESETPDGEATTAGATGVARANGVAAALYPAR